MITALIICIPITALVVGFLVLQSVRMGLQWQIETKKDETPSPVMENPIKPIIEAKQTEQQKNEQAQVFSEWLYGEEETR